MWFLSQKNKYKLATPGFPKLNKEGAQFSFVDIYHGSENKISDMEMTVELIQNIFQYLQANKHFFNTNANGLPSVKSIEQPILILSVTNILKPTHRVITMDEIDEDRFYLELVFNDRGKFNLRNDDCWVKIAVKWMQKLNIIHKF